MSYFSGPAAVSEQFSGLSIYRLLEEIDDHFEEKKRDVIEKLKRLTQVIFRPENLFVDYTAQDEGNQGLTEAVGRLKAALHTEPVKKKTTDPTQKRKTKDLCLLRRFSMCAGQVILSKRVILTPGH